MRPARRRGRQLWVQVRMSAGLSQRRTTGDLAGRGEGQDRGATVSKGEKRCLPSTAEKREARYFNLLLTYWRLQRPAAVSHEYRVLQRCILPRSCDTCGRAHLRRGLAVTSTPSGAMTGFAVSKKPGRQRGNEKRRSTNLTSLFPVRETCQGMKKVRCSIGRGRACQHVEIVRGMRANRRLRGEIVNLGWLTV